MDPAGPIFYSKFNHDHNPLTSLIKPYDDDDLAPVAERLDKSDATFLQVIHSDQFFLGTIDRIGHVDFYVGKNEQKLGSAHQAGCTDLSPKNFVELLQDGCSHGKAHVFLLNSITDRNKYRAQLKCDLPVDKSKNGGCPMPIQCDLCKWRKEFSSVHVAKDPRCPDVEYSADAYMGYWWSGSPKEVLVCLTPHVLGQ